MLNKTSNAKANISIEYIHDVICSWCPIGLRHVNQAIDTLSNDMSFELTFLPFELNPDMPPEGEAIDAYFKRRMGWTSQQFSNYADTVVEKANAVGLVYDYGKRTHYYNTAKAHRLIDIAKQSEQQLETVDALTRLYFRDGGDISNTATLVDLAITLELDAQKVQSALDAKDPTPSLSDKYKRVKSLPVKSTPSMLINGETLVQGSNSTESFIELFSNIHQKQ